MDVRKVRRNKCKSNGATHPFVWLKPVADRRSVKMRIAASDGAAVDKAADSRLHSAMPAHDESETVKRQDKDEATAKLELPPGVKLLRSLEGHQGSVRSVAFDPSGQTLASGSYDSTVKLWERNSGKLLRTLKGHEDEVQSVAFDPSVVLQ